MAYCRQITIIILACCALLGGSYWEFQKIKGQNYEFQVPDYLICWVIIDVGGLLFICCLKTCCLSCGNTLPKFIFVIIHCAGLGLLLGIWKIRDEIRDEQLDLYIFIILFTFIVNIIVATFGKFFAPASDEVEPALVEEFQTERQRFDCAFIDAIPEENSTNHGEEEIHEV